MTAPAKRKYVRKAQIVQADEPHVEATIEAQPSETEGGERDQGSVHDAEDGPVVGSALLATLSRRHEIRRLAPYELEGLIREAFEAYDMQDERVRFDTMNRCWRFGLTKVRENNWALNLTLKRNDLRGERTLDAPVLNSSSGLTMLGEMIEALDQEVR